MCRGSVGSIFSMIAYWINNNNTAVPFPRRIHSHFPVKY